MIISKEEDMMFHGFKMRNRDLTSAREQGIKGFELWERTGVAKAEEPVRRGPSAPVPKMPEGLFPAEHRSLDALSSSVREVSKADADRRDREADQALLRNGFGI